MSLLWLPWYKGKLFGGLNMKNEDVKKGLVVITTVLKEEDPKCFYRFNEGRVPGAAGVIVEPISGGQDENLWLVCHTQGEEGAVYDASEFEPIYSEKGIELETYFSECFVSNECCICGKSPTVASVSFWLAFGLGTHKVVYFCENHFNHVDILKGLGGALVKKALDIEKGMIYRKELPREKSSYLVAIRAVDYDHLGCPHCSYQHPDVNFTPGTISLVWCEKCGMPYAVFADGVRKRSAMVEMLFGYNARAVLKDCPCEDHYFTHWTRVFQCRECSQRYPSDREGTICNTCGGKIVRSKVERESKGAVKNCA